MIHVDANTLLAIVHNRPGRTNERQMEIMQAVGAALWTTLDMSYFAINTRLRIAHFLAQCAEETDGFRTTEEYASGDAYEGRRDLGNMFAGDGRLFKGRGLIMLTGRANYRTAGYEAIPQRAGEPVISLVVACQYWTSHSINAHADRDDLISVTKAVNGGLNGLEDRRAYLGRAKIAVAEAEAKGLAPSPHVRRALHRGLKGSDVSDLQHMLAEAYGKIPAGIAIDGDFGAATERAVKAFQVFHNLEPDGIVGPKTWLAIEAASDP